MPNPRGPRKGRQQTAGLTASNPPPEILATIVSPETQTAVQAILVGGVGWRRRSRRAPTFGDERGTFVSLGDPDRALTAEQEEQAWSRVLSLDDQTAQTFVYAAARYLAENDDPAVRRPVRVHVNELLDYRGLSRHRKGDFRKQHKVEERERLSNLAEMRVSTPVNDGRRRNPRVQSNLLDVAYFSEEDGKQTKLSFLNGDSSQVPYAFDIMLGGWAASAVGSSGQKRAILANIMRYDPREPTQRMAMRLGLYLHFRPSAVLSVQALLDGANLPRPQHHPERFRDNFEEAMDLLRADGIIAAWVFVNETELPRYRWLDEWLAWDVAIQQAPNVIVSQPKRAQLEGRR